MPQQHTSQAWSFLSTRSCATAQVTWIHPDPMDRFSNSTLNLPIPEANLTLTYLFIQHTQAFWGYTGEKTRFRGTSCSPPPMNLISHTHVSSLDFHRITRSETHLSILLYYYCRSLPKSNFLNWIIDSLRTKYVIFFVSSAARHLVNA